MSGPGPLPIHLTGSGISPNPYFGGNGTIAGTGISADHGSILNSGTVQSDIEGSAITGGGTVTITPSTGTSNVIINGDSALATTLQIGPPAYAGQHLRVGYKQSGTPQNLNLGTTIATGSTLASFTATATAGVTDFLQFINANGSRWAFVGVMQGFNV